MSKKLFSKAYADVYDILYDDKDYNAECDLLEEVFHRFGDGPIRSILDLGCGTGNHAILLANRGYEVVGVERSAEMVAHARRKAHALQINGVQRVPSFQKGDLRSLNLGRQFDAILMMFAVLGYQLTNDDVLEALRTVHSHLRSGGLFIADVWYGPAVLKIRPGERIKVIHTSNGKVIRVASGSLDTYYHLAKIHYLSWWIREQQLMSENEETHQMRYFFPQELALFMAQAKLSLQRLCVFGDLETMPSDNSWSVLAISKAVHDET